MQSNSCEKPCQSHGNYLIILVLYILLAILLGSTLFYQESQYAKHTAFKYVKYLSSKQENTRKIFTKKIVNSKIYDIIQKISEINL